MNSARRSIGFLTHAPGLAFPFAAAYMLLMLTNLVYNTFGGDAGGIQFFYASPVRFHEIVLAKNLTHAIILALETIVAWTAVALLYGRPAFDITIATLAGLLFAAPLNFAVGNVLSMYSPKKLDFSKFGRQRASQMTALMGVVLQLVVVGICVGVFSMGAAIRKLLDRHADPAAVGGSFVLYLWNDPATRGSPRAAAPGVAGRRTMPHIVEDQRHHRLTLLPRPSVRGSGDRNRETKSEKPPPASAESATA